MVIALSPVCRYDRERQMIHRGNRNYALTDIQYHLLEYLLSHKDVVVPHAAIINTLWPEKRLGKNECLRVVVMRLRKKIEVDIKNPMILITCYRQGYLLKTVQNNDA